MKWTDEMIDMLRERYPHESTDVLAAELGCTRKCLAYRACVNGIKKTAEFMRTLQSDPQYNHPKHKRVPRRRIATGDVVVVGAVLTHVGY